VARSTLEQNPRSRALIDRIDRIEPIPGRLDALALGLVDAVLEADSGTLAAALDALRGARARSVGQGELRGWLDAAIAFTYWGLERLPPAPGPARGTQAHEFLSALDGAPGLGSVELRQLLEVDDTQISRTGRRLLDSGLVTRRKMGRHVLWQLSPRGRCALEDAPELPRPESTSPDRAAAWLDALRRGFEGEGANGSGTAPRDVDPTRERIVRSALELHRSRGIGATKWKDIAVRAGMSMSAIRAVFPTEDALVRACGQHFLESLRMPPPDRARDVYVGATSEQDRIRRLVQTSFGVYERGADGIVVARREREVPAVGEAMDQFDSSMNALVAEALGSRRLDSTRVASVRALTDLEMWRTIRDQGASPDEAVEQATAAVGRWLEGRPNLAVPPRHGGTVDTPTPPKGFEAND